MIGGFVVVAVILMAASLVLFSSGKFFQKTDKYVLYFDGSLKGLSVGAPVLFRGIQIGSVTSSVIHVDFVQMETQIPVIIEIEPHRVEVRKDKATLTDPRIYMPKFIEKGLRAVLTMQSFITGKLMIELDYFPGTPIILKNLNKEYIEIPTIPGTTEQLEKHLTSALAGIDRFANNPDLAVSIRSLKETLQDARKLVNRVDRQVDPLAQDTKKTVKDFGKLARDLDARVGELAPSLEKTLSAMRGVISDDAPLIVELENTLQAISAASRSFRQMADYLEQHPEAVIRGKGKPGGK
jgi:paraquat-inducible protein B